MPIKLQPVLILYSATRAIRAGEIIYINNATRAIQARSIFHMYIVQPVLSELRV